MSVTSEYLPESYQVVLDFFAAENEDQCKSCLYKNTSCGAWIEFIEGGVQIGSIVEGADFGTSIYQLDYADDFKSKDLQDRIDAVEAEADAIWHWANDRFDENGEPDEDGETLAERDCDAPDVAYDYRHFKQVGTSA